MSKIRTDIPVIEGDLATPPERDLAPFVIFTQLRQDGPFIYAGFVDATDHAMAISLAAEHYGRDQECTRLLALMRDRIAGADPAGALPPGADDARDAEYVVFTQAERGAPHRSAPPVAAATLATALGAAVARHPQATSVWAVHPEDVHASAPDALIWPLTDQSYRLARGYSKIVRAKWEQIRRDRDIVEYEQDDLQETF